MFIRRTAYEINGLYDGSFSYAMDSEWCHRAIKNKLEFREVSAVLANMSLGGWSDLHFFRSLNEYRRSLVLHGLASPIIAVFNFVFYSVMKCLMKAKFFYSIKKYRDKNDFLRK